jgi:hypothetical protein
MLSPGSVTQSALDQGGIQERAIQSVTNTRREEEGLLGDGFQKSSSQITACYVNVIAFWQQNGGPLLLQTGDCAVVAGWSTRVSYTRSIEPSVTCPLLSMTNTLA